MNRSTDPPGPDRSGARGAQLRLIAFVLALAAAGVTYRLVYTTGAFRSAALYVGVPAVLAIGITFVPTQGSATGVVLKGSLLAILLAGVLLPEGLLCLALATPFVLGVATVVGVAVDVARERGGTRRTGLVIVGLPLLILSGEGVVGSPFDDVESAAAQVTVAAAPADVQAAVGRTPTFAEPMPLFLRLGFNRPVAATGAGLQPGDERVITFAHGTHDDHPGRVLPGNFAPDAALSTMRLAVTDLEAGPTGGRVTFTVREDTTMLARWVDLRTAVVTWRAIGPGTTEVTWTLHYRRLLQPTAYFRPLQRYGLSEAAGYLLTSVVGDGR
jgi:hypothetical protein